MKEKIKNILIAWLMPELKAYIDNKISEEMEATTVLLEGHLMEMFGERIDGLERRMVSLDDGLKTLNDSYDETADVVKNLKETMYDLEYDLEHVKDDVSDLENGDNCDLEDAIEELEALKTKLERIKDIL